MAAKTSAAATAAKPDLVLTREFDAPRALVFEAWTKPEHLGIWWGPAHFTNPVCKVDARKGGAIHIDMRSPDGTIFPMAGTFTEMDPPRRLAFLAAPLDAKGAKVFESLTTVTFTEQRGQTLLTVTVHVLNRTPQADMYLAGMEQGWTQSLVRLARQVDAMESDGLADTYRASAEPGQPHFTLTRVFDAPRELVFDATTQPQHLRQWWGPYGHMMTVCEVDLRVGGAWRHVLRASDGSEHAFKGVYQEIDRPRRLVHTFIYDMDGFREYGSVVTTTFEERGGKTVVTATTVHKSVESRDGHFNAGSGGMRETYDRLAALVTRLQRK